MGAIQSRFEVAVPELPDHIDPASYSKSHSSSLPEHGRYKLTRDERSDVMRSLLSTLLLIHAACALFTCPIKLYYDTAHLALG